MDASSNLTEDIQSKQLVVDHPLAAVKMASPTAKTSDKPKSYLFEMHIDLLGIRFLKNSQKGFETEVQNAMNYLLHEAIMSSQASKAAQESEGTQSKGVSASVLDLPCVTLRIPSSLSEDVEIHLEKSDLAKFEHLTKATQLNPDELFLIEGTSSLQSYLSQLVAKPITIPVNQLFLYRGQLNTSTERCLALTTNFVPPQGAEAPSPTTSRYQQCLVLHAESPSKVTDILDVFRKLHGIAKNPPPPTKSYSPVNMRAAEYQVVVVANVEIQEEVSEGKWHTCPIDKEGFKLRTTLDKKILISLHQDMTHFNFPIIKVERCFGMLLCPGRNMVSSDMVAIGLNSMNTSSIVGALNPSLQWQISASWVPSELNFEYLNTETPRDTRVYFTIAVDLVVEKIDEPVRFIIEAKAKIVPPSNSVAVSATEKFWQNFASKSTKQMQEQFSLILAQKPITNTLVEAKAANGGDSFKYEVVSCFSATQISQQKQRLSLQLNRAKMTNNESNLSNSSSSQNGHKSIESLETPTEEPEEDDDEPLASGTGVVSKDCSQGELASWKDIMDKWHTNLDVRPKQLSRLVRKGVPEALRPEVWQLLAGSNQEEEKLMQMYRTLVAKDSTFEGIIQRDINRTFPAHESFKEPGSSGQDFLFRICKAYSNYDEEIGYCQGLSFLVAALLLHMPEEQAFCVFVRIMYNYGLRELYRCGLEDLHCKFYQLERLLDDQLPELAMHFLDLNVETHMYASQWFLTLFTTKFPLNAVFLIIDLFLLDKMDTLLQIALALLKMSKNDLLALDFEGVMKYFRVSLPKKYRFDEVARELIRTAVKINVKKSKKYELTYRTWSEQNRRQLNPLEHLEMENKRLMTTSIRLEQENDDLSQELLSTCKSKIKLQADLDMAEDKAETLNTLLLNARTQLVEIEEEKARLLEEVTNLKEMCRKEIERSEREIKKDQDIIAQYKAICQNYQNKYETERERAARDLSQMTEKVKSCSDCSGFIAELQNAAASPGGDSMTSSTDAEMDKSGKDSHGRRVTDLEAELIRTKVALAEAENRNGLLAGKLHSTSSELNLMKAQADEVAHQRSNTWLTKTLSTIRDAAKVKSSNSIPSGISAAASTTTTTNTATGKGAYPQQPPVNYTDTTSLYEVNTNDTAPAATTVRHGNTPRRYSSRDIYHH